MRSAHASRRLRPGVTLVELLVFVAVFAIVAFTVLPLLFTATENRMNQQSMSLVEQNGAQVLQNIGYRLQYAERITDPPPQQEGSVLTLQTGCGATNPTIIGVQSGTMIIIRNRTKQEVTSSEVVVKDFRIQNTSASATQQSFRVSFRVERTIQFKDPRVYARTFEGLFTLSPSDRTAGSACGGVACAAPACAGGSYTWEVCEGQACQEVSLPMDCGGYCCSEDNCLAKTATECTALAGDFYSTQTACTTVCGAPAPVCGNGVVETGEQCDPPGTGCTAECLLQGGASSAGSCGACPPGEMCNPSGFCQRTCTCDADCGAPTVCYTSAWQMRDYPVCEGGFCTGWISQAGCGGGCGSDADCPVGQQCIPDAEGDNFCNFLGWNVGAGCYLPPTAEQYTCQWEAKNPANGPYYINQPVILNLTCWKSSGGSPVAADIQTAFINGAATVIAANTASRQVNSAAAGTITYTANVTPVGGPPITLTTTVTYSDLSLPDWCRCTVEDTTPHIGSYCTGDTLSINYECFDGYGTTEPHEFSLSDTITVSGNDPYYVQDGEVKAYVTPAGAGTHSYVLTVNGVDMKKEDGSPLSCGTILGECAYCCDPATDQCSTPTTLYVPCYVGALDGQCGTGVLAPDGQTCYINQGGPCLSNLGMNGACAMGSCQPCGGSCPYSVSCGVGETEYGTYQACVDGCTEVPTPSFTCACDGVTEATLAPPVDKVCTSEDVIASFTCTEALAGSVQIEGGIATVNGQTATRQFAAGIVPGMESYTLTVNGVEKGMCSKQVYDCSFCPSVTETCLLEASVGGAVLTGPVAPGAQVTLTMSCRDAYLNTIPIQQAMLYVDGGTLLGEATLSGGLAIYRYVTSATATERTYTGIAELQGGECGSAETVVDYRGQHWCNTHEGESRWSPDQLGYPPFGTWPRQNPARSTDCMYECVTGGEFCMENPGAGAIGCGGLQSFPDKCAVKGMGAVCSPCILAPE